MAAAAVVVLVVAAAMAAAQRSLSEMSADYTKQSCDVKNATLPGDLEYLQT